MLRLHLRSEIHSFFWPRLNNLPLMGFSTAQISSKTTVTFLFLKRLTNIVYEILWNCEHVLGWGSNSSSNTMLLWWTTLELDLLIFIVKSCYVLHTQSFTDMNKLTWFICFLFNFIKQIYCKLMIRLQDSITTLKYRVEMHGSFRSFPTPLQYLAVLHRWVSNLKFYRLPLWYLGL